ncbi:transmembrane protein 234 homolog [Macrosteles quadrilineatus]|uniref:transmembrane protein 234 homolog n=1 Tax=Macrosteles quadrilineatus TaxID=74068 RepID=UPI0023E2A19C|nr:transmembrane protein 234 homolog [Macrosteles quadrilineatus]
MDGILYLFAVGLLWGVTNPLIKKGSTGINQVKANNAVLKFFKELQFLVTNWKYMIPFLINQCGSVLYYFALQSANLTFAVPITNSIAFVSTAVTGWCLGETTPNLRTVVGSILVVLGTACYILDTL